MEFRIPEEPSETTMKVFIKAIGSHIEWISVLRQQLDEQVFLNAKGVGNNGIRDLGRWLQTEGGLHSSLPSFASVRTLRERFHRHAAAIFQATNEAINA